jgi:hypothetical protein
MSHIEKCSHLSQHIYSVIFGAKRSTDTLNIDSMKYKVLYEGSNVMDLQTIIYEETNKNRLFVVFRGSESVRDWLVDMFAVKTSIGVSPQITAHKGVAMQLSAGTVCEDIKKTIVNYGTKDTEVFFTGHSLGGALAIIAPPMIFGNATKRKIQVVTFGAPRCVNSSEYKTYMKSTGTTVKEFRYKHDPITLLPLFRYGHIGDQFEFGKCWKKRNTGHISFFGRISSLLRCSVRDHYMSNYSENWSPRDMY